MKKIKDILYYTAWGFSTLFNLAIAIGSLTLLSVGRGLHVQGWWRPFGLFTYYVARILEVTLKVALVSFAIFLLCALVAFICKKFSRCHRYTKIVRNRWENARKLFAFFALLIPRIAKILTKPLVAFFDFLLFYEVA